MDQFSYYLSIERQLSPNTVASYGAEVAAFLDFLGGKKAPECCSDDIVAYMASRSGELSKRSQAHALSALRSFFDFLILCIRCSLGIFDFTQLSISSFDIL